MIIHFMLLNHCINAATLRGLHERVAQSVDTVTNNYEILFVNDFCPPGSLPVLRDSAGRDDRMAVPALEEDVGRNRAVLAGLAHARGRVEVNLDADLLLIADFGGPPDVQVIWTAIRLY